MSKFQVGDAVKVIGGPRRGELATITSPVRVRGIQVAGKRIWGPGPTHNLDLRSLEAKGKFVSAAAEWLEHLHDSRDRGEWDELTLKLCTRQSEKA